MEKFLEIYNKYRDYLLFFFLMIIIVISEGFLFLYFSDSFSELRKEIEKREEEVLVNNKKEEVKEFIVDIKGEVKKPGVYTLEEGKRVIDVVKKAGGFTVYADTYANNLSMKIKDEMVIVIYSESEISNYMDTLKKEKQINEMCVRDKSANDSCVKEEDKVSNKNVSNNVESEKGSTDDESKLVSLNNASLEELMTVSGIGESKAKAIIEYRKEKKFETIEDIKNVSGIGDALFEKIKDYITT